MGVFLTYVPPPQIVVVVQDSGGIVSRYEDMVAKYISEGRRIEIRGMCSSACTLVLTSPNACVAKNGEAAWHQAFDSETHDVLPQVTKRMIQNLPPKLREYLDGRIQRDYTPATILGYEQLTTLGVKSCDEPTEQAANKTPSIMTNAFYENLTRKLSMQTEVKPSATTTEASYAGATKKVTISTVKTVPAPNKPIKQESLGGYWPWGNNHYKVKNCVSGSLCETVSYYDKGGSK